MGPGTSPESSASLAEYLDAPAGDVHRRAASFAIARPSSAATDDDGPRVAVDEPGARDDQRGRSSRRASLSWLRSRAPAGGATRDKDGPRVVVDEPDDLRARSSRRASLSWLRSRAPSGGVSPTPPVATEPRSSVPGAEGGGWRSWKPVRALTHLRMRRAGCLFSVEVCGARGLPPALEGRRLAVTVRKAEARDGAVQTMPCRACDGAAEFDETLFVRCSVYFAGGKVTGRPLRLEPRRFLVSVVDVEGGCACLGTHVVDVSALVLESVERSSEGRRVRWFERAFPLSGKAAGGELLLKLGFQLMEDAGLSLYTQQAGDTRGSPVGSARAHDRNSFSISSARFTPRLSSTDDAVSPSMRAYKQLMDRLRIDESGVDGVISSRTDGGDNAAESPAVVVTKLASDDDDAATDAAGDTQSIPEFVEVVDKGVETVKEVVHYQGHRDVLRELDSIAAQIEAIEAMMMTSGAKTTSPKAAADQQQRLDADEEMVTMDFLRKLELDADKKEKLLLNKQSLTPTRSQSPSPRKAGVPLVPDLGRSLGPVVQTRDGGFLVSMNPFDLPLSSRDESPKLAMQVSRAFVLPGAVASTGFHVLQKMAGAGGADELRDRLASLGGMDDLKGKTPEQVAFEGIAEAVIGGRRTDAGATSSAARSVHLVRNLAAASSRGRSERVATGIWTVGDDPETMDEVLAFCLQKLEAVALDALAVQAEMADEDAPFEVGATDEGASVFDSLVPCDEWSESSSDGRVTLVAAVQLRDPSRCYEAVGAPVVVVVQSARMLGAGAGGRFKVRSLNVGGVMTRCPPAGSAWSASWTAERQKLTAMQWMVAHSPARPAGRSRATTPSRSPRPAQARARVQLQRPDVLWSLSSRVLAGMWLKTVRNPDVRVGAGSLQTL